MSKKYIIEILIPKDKSDLEKRYAQLKAHIDYNRVETYEQKRILAMEIERRLCNLKNIDG